MGDQNFFQIQGNLCFHNGEKILLLVHWLRAVLNALKEKNLVFGASPGSSASCKSRKKIFLGGRPLKASSDSWVGGMVVMPSQYGSLDKKEITPPFIALATREAHLWSSDIACATPRLLSSLVCSSIVMSLLHSFGSFVAPHLFAMFTHPKVTLGGVISFLFREPYCNVTFLKSKAGMQGKLSL